MGKLWNKFKGLFSRTVINHIEITEKAFMGPGGEQRGGGIFNNGGMSLLNHTQTRNNVRNASMTDVTARAMMISTVNSAVGTGLELKAMPDYKVLGITPEEAEEWGNKIERLWNLFANNKGQHRSGTMTFNQIQWLYGLCYERDNDNFVRLYYPGDKKRKLPFPLQFEIYDPSQIRGDAMTSTAGPNSMSDGIKRNAAGEEVSYDIWRQDPANPGKHIQETVLRIGRRSERVMMLHGYKSMFPGQTRGISEYATILQSLADLTKFRSSIIGKAITQARILMSVENMQSASGNPFSSGMPVTRKNVASALTGGSGCSTEDVVTRNVEGLHSSELNVLGVPVGGIAAVNMEQGDTLRLHGNNAPVDEYDRFESAVIKGVMASSGKSKEFVEKQFGNSFSASRAALRLMWDTLKVFRADMSTDFNDVIYEALVSELIANGSISAPGWQDPILRLAWLNCKWLGSAAPSIDPAKTAKASKDNIEMNLSTPEIEAKDLNGSDAMANKERNRVLFKDSPDVPWVHAASASAPVDDDMEDEDEDEDKNENDDKKRYGRSR